MIWKKHLGWLIPLATLLALGLVVICYYSWSATYRWSAQRALSGEIAEVQYERRPGDAHGVTVTNTDQAMISEIRQWLLAAEEPEWDEHPPATCLMKVIMRDGRTITLHISPTDRSLGYATIEWNGYYRMGGNEPFSRINDIMIERRLRETERLLPPATSSSDGATVPREAIRTRLLEFQKEISAAATSSVQGEHITGLYEYLVEQQDTCISQQKGPAFSWTIEVIDLGTNETKLGTYPSFLGSGTCCGLFVT